MDGSDVTLLKQVDNSAASCFASPDSTRVTPASNGDEILFSQYLRSPSQSPVPSTEGTLSESSEATLVTLQQNQSCENLKLSLATSANVVHEELTTPHKGRPSHVRAMPRIRLRVNQPKITLRLKVSRISPVPGHDGMQPSAEVISKPETRVEVSSPKVLNRRRRKARRGGKRYVHT